MKTIGYYILAFDSTHHAIRTEGQLKKNGLEGEVIPTPRDIDASCGLSIKIPSQCLERVKQLIDLSENRVKLYGICTQEGRTVYVEKKM